MSLFGPNNKTTYKLVPLMWAWAVEHDSHGLFLNDVFWLPASERPEAPGLYMRMPHLDRPVDLLSESYCVWRSI